MILLGLSADGPRAPVPKRAGLRATVHAHSRQAAIGNSQEARGRTQEARGERQEARNMQ